MLERHKRILEALTHAQKQEVAALATKIGVSPVTMRKDLDALEKRGLLRREHGYAVLGPSDDLGNRLAVHFEEKQRIAKLAAGSVSPGETVMIESGSTCALLAETLVKTVRDVKIITNSAFIAGYVRSDPGAKVVLLGGEYQRDSQVMVGPLVRVCVEQFYVDKLFIGTDGITERLFFTNSDMMRAEAVKAMRKQAGKVMVLTESHKFREHGVVPVLSAGDVHAVYTDANIPAEMEGKLTAQGVSVYKT